MTNGSFPGERGFGSARLSIMNARSPDLLPQQIVVHLHSFPLSRYIPPRRRGPPFVSPSGTSLDEYCDMSEDGWLTACPADGLSAGRLLLIRASVADLDELVEAVDTSRDHLRPWMPWAKNDPSDSVAAFLGAADGGWDTRREFAYVMRLVGTSGIVGCCGLHARIGQGALEIGYWVHVDHTGTGLGTSAAAALTDAALHLPGVDRVEIRCDAANTVSASIPRRLGFSLERIELMEPEAPRETGELMVWIRYRDERRRHSPQVAT